MDGYLAFSTLTENEADVPCRGPSGEAEERRVGGGLYNTGNVTAGSSIIAQNIDHRLQDDTHYAPDCWSGQLATSVGKLTSGRFVGYLRCRRDRTSAVAITPHPACQFSCQMGKLTCELLLPVGDSLRPAKPVIRIQSSSERGRNVFQYRSYCTNPHSAGDQKKLTIGPSLF